MQLKNFDFTSLFILQIFVNCEYEHEGKEDTSTP